MNLSKLTSKKMLTIFALILVLGAGLALPAQAVLIDFTLGYNHGGTISFAGGTAPLMGAGIDVGAVVDKSTTNTPIAIQNGVLSFSTGPLSGYVYTPSATPVIKEWDFGAGNNSFITITGAITALDINDPNTILLQGTFNNGGTAWVKNVFEGYSMTVDIAGATFQDTKNSILLEYFKLPGNTQFVGTLNLSFTIQDPNFFNPNYPIPPGAFTSTTMGSGDLMNFPVPIPGSVLLLGTGLLGLGLLRFRRKNRA